MFFGELISHQEAEDRCARGFSVFLCMQRLQRFDTFCVLRLEMLIHKQGFYKGWKQCHFCVRSSIP